MRTYLRGSARMLLATMSAALLAAGAAAPAGAASPGTASSPALNNPPASSTPRTGTPPAPKPAPPPPPPPTTSTTTPPPPVAPPAAPLRRTMGMARALATHTGATSILGGPGSCSATSSTDSYDLTASTGLGSTGALLGVPFWGFAVTGTAPTAPGPILYMCAPDTLKVTLHNNLPTRPDGGPDNLALEIVAANGPVDTTGIAVGAAGTYTFSGFAPGTYMYEAGPTAEGPRQDAMGLAGLLVVRPSDYSSINQTAYGAGTNSSFLDEAALQLAEVATDFNTDPWGHDTHEFDPNVFTINGVPYGPGATNDIAVAAGDVTFLHIANFGLRDHTIDVLGHRQRLVGQDSHALLNPADIATAWLTPGQVSDSLVTIDPTATVGSTFPIFDGGLHFATSAGGGLGGMLARFKVAVGVGGTPAGPVTSAFTITNATNKGGVDMPVTATLNFTTPSTYQGAEWFVDNIGASGSGTPVPPAACRPGGTTGATVWNCAFTISWTDFVNALARDNTGAGLDGDHAIWLHAEGTVNTWGVATGDVVTINTAGPATVDVTLHSSPTNGVTTVNDMSSEATPFSPDATAEKHDLIVVAGAMSSLPDWVVLGAYACIDATDCSGANRYNLFTNPPPTGTLAGYGVAYPAQSATCTPQVTPGPASPPAPPAPAPGGGTVVSICGNIPQAVLAGLAEGVHSVYVHSYEGYNFAGSPVPLGWGIRSGPASLVSKLVIDRTGPATTGASITPPLNNGFQVGPGNLAFLDSTLVTATINDSATGGSNAAGGEVFLVPSAVPAGSPAGTLPACNGNVPPAPGDFGTGAAMIPSNGTWNAPSVTGYAYIPLTEIQGCASGTVVFWIHGKDAAGNWGPWTTATITLDRTAPVISSLTAAAGTVTVVANDPGTVSTNVAAAEWFVGADPGVGNGHAFAGIVPANPLTVSFAPGVTGTVNVRVMDGAGNWSAVRSVTV